jgi:hypothetical protein
MQKSLLSGGVSSKGTEGTYGVRAASDPRVIINKDKVK